MNSIMKRIVDEIEALELILADTEDEGEKQFLNGKLSALRWTLNRVIERKAATRKTLDENEGEK